MELFDNIRVVEETGFYKFAIAFSKIEWRDVYVVVDDFDVLAQGSFEYCKGYYHGCIGCVGGCY